MWECEGESACARGCESVSEKEDPRSLFITIITRHHRHHLFNPYIDIQVCIYMYCETIFSVRNKCITNTVRARPSLSPTTKAACPLALAVHTWFRALAQAASKRRFLLRATLPPSCRTASFERQLFGTIPRPSVHASTGSSRLATARQRSSRGMSSSGGGSTLASCRYRCRIGHAFCAGVLVNVT